MYKLIQLYTNQGEIRHHYWMDASRERLWELAHKTLAERILIVGNVALFIYRNRGL